MCITVAQVVIRHLLTMEYWFNSRPVHLGFSGAEYIDYDVLGENCEYVIIHTISNIAVMSLTLYNRSY